MGDSNEMAEEEIEEEEIEVDPYDEWKDQQRRRPENRNGPKPDKLRDSVKECLAAFDAKDIDEAMALKRLLKEALYYACALVEWDIDGDALADMRAEIEKRIKLDE